MRHKTFYMLLIAIMVLGSINLVSAQEELGRKGTRKSRYGIGLAIGTRSYLDSDFFKNHPEGLVPADLRGNSYTVLAESTPSPGFFGVELLASLDMSKTEAPKTGNEHLLKPLILRLSGKIHPFTNMELSRYFDFYIGGGVTGVTFSYETKGLKAAGLSDSYKSIGPHAVAGFEYYLGTFSSGKWRWGVFVDYLFTSLNVERVRRDPNNLEDRPDFDAGGHLFIFGVKFNSVR